MPKVKFHTLGCKVNQYETQEMLESCLRCGLTAARHDASADIVVINTCTVTHKTDTQSLALVRKARRENRGAFIVVTGCLAERDADAIRAVPQVDCVIGNKHKARITEFIRSNRRFSSLLPASDIGGISSFAGHTRAFLKVQDGCDNRCSYCKVWIVRGRSRSRPLEKVRTEALRLCEAGFQELVLCGICLGAYGRDIHPETNLLELVEKISAISTLKRIRLSSIEAADLSTVFLRNLAQIPKICRHLHIPLQSGDDRILRAMNRRYRRSDYLRRIDAVRKYLPGCAVSTDILVGFPGERAEHFANTLALIKRITPMRVHAFPYSGRPGTAAFMMKPVDAGEVKERMELLQQLSRECALRYARDSLGTTMAVLFEERCKHGRSSWWQGYTDTYLRVRARSAEELCNRIVPVDLKTAVPGTSGIIIEGKLRNSRTGRSLA